MALWRILLLKTLSILFMSGSLSAQSGNDSCGIQISLLTCSPGQELYSTFGHSSFRVRDANAGLDIIFNYGTFDFNDPQFYSKFVNGKLLYFVSVENFQNFSYAYQLEGRGIIEQELSLSCESKSRLFYALRENLKEENKFYLYDFLFDNCSTRLRDILKKESGEEVIFHNILPEENKTTFRNLIHEYLDKGGQYWSKSGIDLLLGAKLDRQMLNEEAMFLPDYLMKGFDASMIDGSPLVSKTEKIQPALFESEKNQFTSPLVIHTIILIVIALITFLGKEKAKGFLKIFDTTYFFLTGFVGFFILYMWFGTAHALCGNNYNLLWALPLNLIVAFLIQRNQIRHVKLFSILTVWYGIIIVLWFLLPQEMNIGFLPLVLIGLFRIYNRSGFINKKLIGHA